MNLKQYQTEWIFTHLLFPNSAQARDIFLYLISETKKPILDEVSKQSFFKKISSIYTKAVIVQSGSPFSSFNLESIQFWTPIFKKLDKAEILLLLGSIYLELSQRKTGEIFRLSDTEIKNKLNKIIYKVFPKPSSIKNFNTEFKFKKYNSEPVSSFFIFDDVISVVLKNSDIQSLLNYSGADQIAIQKYYGQVNGLRNQLMQLNQISYEYPEMSNLGSEIRSAQSISVSKKFHWFLVSSVIVSCLILFVMKPNFIENRLAGQSSEIIEIQSLHIDRHSEQKNKDSRAEDNKIETSKMASTDVTATLQTSLKVSADHTIVGASEPVKRSVPKDIESAVESKKSLTVVKTKTTGGLFRGRLIVTDVGQVVDVVKEKIVNLGGKKAGEVELGWMKNDVTSYFHFSLPEQHIDEFKDYLRQFGKVEIAHEPHPRLMPKGSKRYIIEIKQNE